MNKPQLILELEKELNCNFKLVELNEIAKFKSVKTFEYSVDDTGNITGIAIQSNDLEKIPIEENAAHLNYLTSLNLSGNEISDIKTLAGLRNLTILKLTDNQIVDISPLKELKNIRKLHLRDNEIEDISSLKNLGKLKELDMIKNNIKILPDWITNFPNLKIEWVDYPNYGYISLKKNPIENVPLEIIKQGKAAIKAWFAANKKKLNEIKVLLVGDAEAGKTSICKRLKDNTFDKHEKQTDGIKIEKMVFADLPTFAQQARLHGLSAYVWDFGGQEIMTSTHRFFLTNRSIYILVLEARNDKSTETQIRKWLENITSQGGNSPVIIAVNKIDVNPAFDIDMYNLRKEFPQIVGYVRISCEKDENLHQLK